MNAKSGPLTKLIKGQSEIYPALMEYGDIYAKGGASEQYTNMIREKFGFSKRGAASIGMKRSPEVKKYISTYKGPFEPSQYRTPTSEQRESNARKAAIEIGDKIKDTDSILAIVNDFKKKNPAFDDYTFLDQMSKDKDRLGLTDYQRNELTDRADWTPNWADMTILPSGG